MVSRTSARPSAGLPGEPAKMTSSIFPPRSALAPCSPRTHAMASTTLLLPDPFGPTTHVMPVSRLRVVVPAKDLKPRSVRLFRCIGGKLTRAAAKTTNAPPKGGAFRFDVHADGGGSGERGLHFQSAQLITDVHLRR